MTSIRNRGRCPCPRCKVPLSACHLLGTKRDRKQRLQLQRIDDSNHREVVARARFEIYNKNQHVNGARVERYLKEHSLVPTSVRQLRFLGIHHLTCFHQLEYQNAFSDRLSPIGLNFYSLFVVDLMHEVELGVWKSLMIHLLRILACEDENLLHKLDER